MKRFWDKVDTSGDCWLWTGSKTRKGYGLFNLEGRTVRAHRLAYELHTGRPPSGHVLHSCDTPACVNPSHLRAGTPADNTRDMDDRGRRRRPVRSKANTSGKLGVCKDSRVGWKAYFKHSGRHLQKWFRSLEDAVAQRRAWEAEYL